MDSNGEAGFFFNLDDCKIIFPRLKREEPSLSKGERAILLKIEKVLYGRLSIREIEELSGDGRPVFPGSSDE